MANKKVRKWIVYIMIGSNVTIRTWHGLKYDVIEAS